MSETRRCEFRTRTFDRGRAVISDWRPGVWHAWSLNHDEYEDGPGHWPAAIVEDPATGAVHSVFASNVRFAPTR